MVDPAVYSKAHRSSGRSSKDQLLGDLGDRLAVLDQIERLAEELDQIPTWRDDLLIISARNSSTSAPGLPCQTNPTWLTSADLDLAPQVALPKPRILLRRCLVARPVAATTAFAMAKHPAIANG